MEDKLKNKLSELGFVETDNGYPGSRYFSKRTGIGAPCNNSGDRIDVFVEVAIDGKCTIAIDSFNKFGNVVIEYKDLSPEFFARNLKTLERQIVYAWRELAD